MGGALTDAVWIFAAFLVLIVAAAVALATRRYLLERSGGTVECAMRRPAVVGNWRLGLLSFQRDELYWYGALGVLYRPEQVFQRRALTVVSRRPAAVEEGSALGADRIVVEVAVKPPADASGSQPGEHLELAMSDSALTGFLAWLESSPPGSHLEDFALNVALNQDQSQRHSHLERTVASTQLAQDARGNQVRASRRLTAGPLASEDQLFEMFVFSVAIATEKTNIYLILMTDECIYLCGADRA